jgi:hypothetical protein
VEHRFVNDRERDVLLSNNLSETYCAIAQGVPRTEFVDGVGWKAASNGFPHPICNFAVCDDRDDLDARSLATLASRKPFFNAYVCHFGDQDLADSALERQGMTRVYAMAIMAFQGPPAGVVRGLTRAETPLDRKRIADFMMWQFFSTQTPDIRETIAFATVDSSRLELYDLAGVEFRVRPVAAVMLHRTEGVLGLYNLCVGMAYRRKGFGVNVVRSVQLMSDKEHVIVGLQCDPLLVPWYESLGFREVGRVDVYTLRKVRK